MAEKIIAPRICDGCVRRGAHFCQGASTRICYPDGSIWEGSCDCAECKGVVSEASRQAPQGRLTRRSMFRMAAGIVVAAFRPEIVKPMVWSAPPVDQVLEELAGQGLELWRKLTAGYVGIDWGYGESSSVFVEWDNNGIVRRYLSHSYGAEGLSASGSLRQAPTGAAGPVLQLSHVGSDEGGPHPACEGSCCDVGLRPEAAAAVTHCD